MTRRRARWSGVGAMLGAALALPACTVRMDLPPGGDGGPGADARSGLDARADGGACATDRDCRDRIACSIDRCVAGACAHTACVDCCPVGLACDPTLGCASPPEPCAVDGECSDGIRCTLDSCGTDGFCGHVPEPGLCGSGEVCLAGVGCIPTPPTSCSSLDDCRAGSSCAADWLCEPEFGCTFVAPLDCGDGDACTVDGCDDAAGGCTHTPVDVDGDGHAPEACTGGDDCDDGDAAISPDAAEVCNSVDDDCDDTIDEGCCVPGPCTSSCGTAGTMGCNPDGTPTACAPPAEACNGTDDDCDGSVDEGCCTAGPCTTSCGTTGVRGCNPDGTPGTCAPPAETCNDVDDDCDGTVDDGFACRVGASTACTTGCGSMGTRACLPGCALDSVCVPPSETCNGADDDCDGSVDDGFTCAAGSSRACTTACGSTGAQACSASCGLGACVPPAEICNGVDDDCDGTRDEGCCTPGPCTTSCGTTGTMGCNADGTPGACVPPAETCNASDDDCNGAIDEDFECVRGTSTSCPTVCGSTGTTTCRAGSCTYGACVPPAEVCNGVDDDCDAACDDGFSCCRGATTPCSALGFFAGTATCAPDCGRYVTSGCTNCGNGVLDTGEACDGTQLGGALCTTIPGGFNGGTLRCGAGCMLDTSMCTRCGDGVRQGAEQCDTLDLGSPPATCASRGYTGGGTLRCSAACAFDTSMCIWSPTGTWVVTPGVNHYCAFGAVSISFGNLTFNDTGAALSVSGGGLNCTMTGASARVSRMFDVSCSLPGGCTETYRLVGTFTGDNTWTGTFTMGLTGSGCFDCSSRTFSGLTGSR